MGNDHTHTPDATNAGISYPQDTPAAIPRFVYQLAARIAKEGALKFSDFMAAALYDSEHGYYSAVAPARTGRKGDFFTSVSVGGLFGHLLSQRVIAVADAQPSGQKIRLIEIAAHTGDLAADMASQLADLDYDHILVETSPTYRDQLAMRLPAAGIYASIDLVPPSDRPTVIISNELIDAFPVDSYQIVNGAWHERLVDFDSAAHQFKFSTRPAPDADLPPAGNFRENTLAERRTGVAAFAKSLHNVAHNSLIITIDYGFPASDLYHPDRVAGTLSAYRDHQVIEDVLQAPGLCDLTAHVDFTELAGEFKKQGFEPTLFTSQSSYLTHLARPLLLQYEVESRVDPKFLRQLQTLTHPGILGRSFHVLEAKSPTLPDAPVTTQADTQERLEL